MPAEVARILPRTAWQAGRAYDLRVETGVWLISRWPMMFRHVPQHTPTRDTMQTVSEAK